MVINGISSLTFITSDIDRAIEYYTIIGHKNVFSDHVMKADEIKASYGVTDVAAARCIVLQKDDYDFGMVKLVQLRNEDGAPITDSPYAGYGAPSIAYRVEDLEKVFANIKVDGCEIISGIRPINLPKFGDCRVFLAKSHEGIYLEIFGK